MSFKANILSSQLQLFHFIKYPNRVILEKMTINL